MALFLLRSSAASIASCSWALLTSRPDISMISCPSISWSLCESGSPSLRCISCASTNSTAIASSTIKNHRDSNPIYLCTNTLCRAVYW